MENGFVLPPPEGHSSVTQQPRPISLPPEQREVICVLGGRSGTSLVARLANILGVYLGPEEHMIAPSPVNESGFQEHREIVELNDEILARHGARWPSLVPLPQGWEIDPGLEDLRERALKFIHREFADAGLWGWKDPRACVTLPFWQTIVPRMRYILCFRNPVDTARSNAETLKAAMNENAWGALAQIQERLYRTSLVNWLEFVRNMLEQTSGKPRMVLLYEDVMEHTDSELRRIARFIGKPAKGTDPKVLSAVHEFKAEKLRHHKASLHQVLAENPLPRVAKSAYLSLRARVTLEREAQHAAEQGDDQNKIEQALPLHFSELEEGEAVWRASKDHVHRMVVENTPVDAELLIASHGDDELVTVTGRRGRHFPQNECGTYSGCHPADSAEAIAALRDAQARGATFLLIPKRQLWWLDHYGEFREHLENQHRRTYSDEFCVLYHLQQGGIV